MQGNIYIYILKKEKITKNSILIIIKLSKIFITYVIHL